MTDVERETLRMLVLLAECELEAENARLKQELADYIGMRDPDLDLDTKGRFLAAKRRRSGHEGLNRARADEGQKAQDAYNNQAQARVQTVGLVAPSYSEAAQTEDEVAEQSSEPRDASGDGVVDGSRAQRQCSADRGGAAS